MKTYNEYYELCKVECEDSILTSESMYGERWWRKHSNLQNSTNNDFIKLMVDKNDAPIIKNTTNVFNSNWCILHHILSHAVVDYMIEHHINDDVYSYSININLDKPNKRWSIYLKKSENESIVLPESEPYDFPSFEFISDEKVIGKFDRLNSYIYKYVNDFFEINKEDIPKITNNINFCIDDISYSVEKGGWQPSSESSLSIGWDRNGDENADELLVVSM